MNLIKVIKNPKPYFFVALNRTTNFFRTYFYRGNNVLCEICGWKGRVFFNGKCPKCNSLPRTRLIPFSLGYFDLVKSNISVLHIAPNVNEYNYVKKRFPQLSRYDRLNIRNVKHINLVKDITKTNIEDQTYNLIISWHVFEHIPDDLKAIFEVYRLLKPEGKLLISVPIYPVGNLKTFEDVNS